MSAELFPSTLSVNYITFHSIFQILSVIPGMVLSWHGFDNTDYHCWDLTASASNTLPIICEGLYGNNSSANINTHFTHFNPCPA